MAPFVAAAEARTWRLSECGARRICEPASHDLPAVTSSDKFEVYDVSDLECHCRGCGKGHRENSFFRDQFFSFDARSNNSRYAKKAFERSRASTDVKVVLTAPAFLERCQKLREAERPARPKLRRQGCGDLERSRKTIVKLGDHRTAVALNRGAGVYIDPVQKRIHQVEQNSR